MNGKACAINAARQRSKDMQPTIIFPHPAPPRPATRLVPVFLPFAGCPGRCVYCAQPLATGVAETPDLLERAFAELCQRLEQAAVRGDGPCELGFFGGTFTALPGDWAERFLDLAAAFRGRGLIRAVRCSTRPDRADPAALTRFKGLGLDLVELGVQSFDPACLAASGRGYGQDQALAACAAVRAAGLGLGVQLLPGLPGMPPDPDGPLARDLDAVLAIRPDAVRLYPCVVLPGTRLARDWAAGNFQPWSTAEAAELLGRALLALWSEGIPVIRVGLAPEPGLADQVLAGPWHPALGQMASSRALFAFIRGQMAGLGRRPRRLLVPWRRLSDILGHGREMLPAWEALGLSAERIQVWDRAGFGLE